MFTIKVQKAKKKGVEMPGIEPGASYMRSKRSTAELHPLHCNKLSTLAMLILRGFLIIYS